MRLALFQRFVERGFQFYRTHLDFLKAETAVTQQVLDEVVHTLCGINNAIGKFLARGIHFPAIILQQRPCESEHRAQGGAQIVGDRIRKGFHRSIGFGQFDDAFFQLFV